ncbi:MAG: response regulator transcription factor [Microbacteriaceae bacterium]|nr:response regulator transcription factor [Microbacteriaceae bacterium]MCL2795980.1 response regulator transcription factor [Microbacteriaceae bacterium]
MTPIRIVLVDDQALFRAGVRMLIESQPDLVFAGEAGDGVQARKAVAAARPDVVLMDVRMPLADGIQTTRDILADAAAGGHEPPRVLVLTTFDLDENAARAIRAGASGFVLKDADPEFLLAAIRTVHQGNAVIAATATRELFAQVQRGAERAATPATWSELTAREREIFRLAARGMSNAEIAESEFLSEATVKTHISRVLAKLGLRDRVQLVVFSYEHELPTED